MIQFTEEETKKEKFEKAMEVIVAVSKKLKSGDNAILQCPICDGELVVYKPFRKKIAARCKTENCIRIVK